MLPSVADGRTDQQLDDLVAFLPTLKLRPRAERREAQGQAPPGAEGSYAAAEKRPSTSRRNPDHPADRLLQRHLPPGDRQPFELGGPQ